MTLKQAYEVFFPQSNEKITKKFIKDNITESELRKRYVALVKEWHPDTEKVSGVAAELLNLVQKEINIAKDIMNWAIDGPGNKSLPGNSQDLTILKIKEERRRRAEAETRQKMEDMKKLKDEYLGKIEVAYNLMYKEIIEQFLRSSRTTKVSLLASLPLKMTYQAIEEFGITAQDYEQRLKNLENEKSKAIARINKGNVTREDFEKILQSFAKGFYKDLMDKDKLRQLNAWIDKGKRRDYNNEINNNTAEINNLTSKIIARLTLAREVFNTNQTLLKLEILKRLLNDGLFSTKLSKADAEYTSDYEKRLNRLSQDLRTIEFIDAEIEKKYAEWAKLKAKYESMPKKDLDKAKITEIDAEITELLPENYRELLNNFYELAGICERVKNSKDDIAAKKQQAKALADDSRNHVISQIKANQEMITDILSFLPEESLKIKYYSEDVLKRMPDEKLAELSIFLKNEAFTLKRKAINKYHFLCQKHYIASRNITSAMVLEEAFDECIASNFSPVAVDECYKYFRSMYELYVQSAKKTNVSENLSKQYLIDELQRIAYVAYPLLDGMPDDLLELYNNRYTMSIDDLFELYKRFNKKYLADVKDKKTVPLEQNSPDDMTTPNSHKK